MNNFIRLNFLLLASTSVLSLPYAMAEQNKLPEPPSATNGKVAPVPLPKVTVTPLKDSAVTPNPKVESISKSTPHHGLNFGKQATTTAAPSAEKNAAIPNANTAAKSAAASVDPVQKGAAATKEATPPLSAAVPHGKELVSIDFPNGVNLSDIIKTIGTWTGKNFVLGQGVSGGAKISIISQEPVTKEEAYQAFLSALNISGFTTVDAGKIVKILPITNAKSSSIKTYYGENWAPATDEIINHVVPLRYIDVNIVVQQLRPLLGLTQYAQFSTTNSLILTDTGNRIRRILEIIKLLDDKTSQSQVSIVPINYTDAKDMSQKVTEIFGSRGGTSIALQKALIDERTNSIILVGPAHTLDDIVRFIQRIDKPSINQTAQALIRVRPLDYADAEKLAATLQALTQNTNIKKDASALPKPPFLPGLPGAPQMQAPTPQQGQASATDISGAKVTADKSTNSLIIQGSSAAYNELDTIITELDKKLDQVYIEANMIDINADSGLDWAPAALGGGTTPNGLTIPFGFRPDQAVGFTSSLGASSATATSAFSAANGKTVLGILSNKTVEIGGIKLTPGALIYALKTNSNSNVLQTPSMMVSDNQEANFESTDEFNKLVYTPNPTGVGNVQSPQKYTAVTSLKVTPQISRADTVNLKINVQNDNVEDAGGDNVPPRILKRTALSVVTVHDGQTTVLGGLIKNGISRSETKVPLLGDIPILGWLFKTVKRDKLKQSLSILITPHIVRDANDLAKIYDQSIKARDDYLKAFYGDDFKEEEFYAQYPKEKDGQVQPKRKRKDGEDDKSKKNIEFMQHSRVLPSQEANPINAPAVERSGGVGPSSPGQAPIPPPLP